MKFEIINPSDPYTMEADDLEIAAVAVSILGNGKYPLKGLDDARGQDVPAFLFGGHNEWFTEKFGGDYKQIAERAIETRADALARAFESVTLQSERRSSMNNIGARAAAYALDVRAKVAA
jgi:hypothetical protein